MSEAPRTGLSFRLRPYRRPADTRRVAVLYNRVYPQFTTSAPELASVQQALAQGGHLQKMVLALGPRGRLLGAADIWQDPETRAPHRVWCEVIVDPRWRRRGVGRSLWSWILEQCAVHDLRELRTEVREADRPSVRFAAHRGFRLREKAWRSELRVPRRPDPKLAQDRSALTARGIEVTTLAREGYRSESVRRALYALDAATLRDEPRGDPYVPASFEDYSRMFFDSPGVLPEARFLARFRGRYVASSEAVRDGDRRDRLRQGYTGTLRAYRGRGIARLLKREVIEYARTHGYRILVTRNNSRNVAMWSLNRSLGFERRDVQRQLGRTVRPAALPGPARRRRSSSHRIK